jgi:TrmH family RNA methyltransferase
MTITSVHNDTLKEIRRLARRNGRERTGRFVAEGEDLVREAARYGWEPVTLLAAEGSGLPGLAVEKELLASVSSLGSGTRTIGVYETRLTAPVGPLCVSLHGVGDPGNVGTILRSALAFGASSVALGPGCADPFGPKAVRASMGAVFAVPVGRITSLDELPGETIALAGRRGDPLVGPAVGDVSILIGAERDGLPPEVLAAADRAAHIPIDNESLNAAMAATVALYELTRVNDPSAHRMPPP